MGVQVPRLTTMLRAFATEAGALNVDALYLARQQILEQQKLQSDSAGQVPPFSELHEKIAEANNVNSVPVIDLSVEFTQQS